MDNPSPTPRPVRSVGQPLVTVTTVVASELHDEADDARAADRRRRQLRGLGIVPIEPDDRIGVLLDPGERVVALRRDVDLDLPPTSRLPAVNVFGDLYITTRRLICLGAVPVFVPLGEISDAVIAPGTLRLLVGDSRGIEVRVRDPRVLRVEIGAVRVAARRPGG